MPLSQEPTFHDRQCQRDEIDQFTSSGSFVDITGATFATKDLGQEAVYFIWFSVILSGSLNNTTASFQLLVDASPVSMGNIFLKSKDLDVGYTLLVCAGGISAGSVLQVQWLTDKGTLALSEYGFMIDGIPQSRIVE